MTYPPISDDDRAFVYRAGESEKLALKLRKHQLAALIGPAQCGKSFLVREGLLPLLEKKFAGKAGPNWKTLTITDIQAGLEPLAAQLAQPGILHPAEKVSPTFEQEILEKLNASSSALADLYRNSPWAQQYNLLIVIDPFDPISELALTAPKLAQQWAELIVQSVTDDEVAIYVLVLLRPESLTFQAQHRELDKLIRRDAYMLRSLSQQELEEAIRQVVHLRGNGRVEIDAELCLTLVRELSTALQQLYKLQDIMNRTWDYWAQQGQGPILREHYQQALGKGPSIAVKPSQPAPQLQTPPTIQVQPPVQVQPPPPPVTPAVPVTASRSEQAQKAYNTLGAARRQDLAAAVFKALTAGTHTAIATADTFGKLRDVIGLDMYAEGDLRDTLEHFRIHAPGLISPPAPIPLEVMTPVQADLEVVFSWEMALGWIEQEKQDAAQCLQLARAALAYQAGQAADYQASISWWNAKQPSPSWLGQYVENPQPLLELIAALSAPQPEAYVPPAPEPVQPVYTPPPAEEAPAERPKIKIKPKS
ncbi:MAG: hypothetical protein SF053_16000 [Bacteroidia bacterium]|nr:hypothetical protein [Bacteroidia bacterium]